MTRDDIGIKDMSESNTLPRAAVSPPSTPRSLRLERVAAALAKSSEDLQAATAAGGGAGAAQRSVLLHASALQHVR